MTWLVGALTVIAIVSAGGALAPGGRAGTRRWAAAPEPSARVPTVERGRRWTRTVDRTLPDLLDLFVVTVQAGYTPLDALRSLRPLVHPDLAAVLQAVLARVERGERFVDALSSFTEALGSRGATFVDTLTMTERAGLPLGPAIDRLADDARQHRRRLAEADARQLPVRLSFPLVLCTLTSFVLVAIVPLLLGALTSFDRSSP